MNNTTKLFKICRLLQTEATEYYNKDLNQSQINFYKKESKEFREEDNSNYPLVIVFNNKHKDIISIFGICSGEVDNSIEEMNEIYKFYFSKLKDVDISIIKVDDIITLLTMVTFPQAKRVINLLPLNTSDKTEQYNLLQYDLINSFLNNPNKATLVLEIKGSQEDNWELNILGLWKDE